MFVREIMTRKPWAVSADTPVSRARELLRIVEVRHLPVVNDDRELVGIVTDRELAAWPETESEPTELVSNIMSTDVPSVEAQDDLRDAIVLMVENRVGAVPVIDPDLRVVGIVSYLDVLRSMGSDLG